MRLRQPVEIMYLALMSEWHKSSPPDGHLDELDGIPARNTQITRLAYILNKIAVPKLDRTFSTLAVHVRRDDGNSYISRDRSWMTDPVELLGDWYFEGCTSLEQKARITQALTKVGLSPHFVRAVDDFIAGKSVDSYFPTDEEAAEILKEYRDHDERSAT